MNGTNGGNWIEWTDYSDNSGIVALLRVGSERFSCSFTSAPKVIPVSNPGAQRSVSKRTMGIAKWAFEKELKLRATPEHLAAIVAFYAAPEVA